MISFPSLRMKPIPRFQVQVKEYNDLCCTIIDSLSSHYNLSTIIKQITTYNHGSFNHSTYLLNPIQPFGCIESTGINPSTP